MTIRTPVSFSKDAEHGRLLFVFGIHCHQPVGRQESAVDEDADKCYLPFLRAAAEHPSFKFCGHFSGSVIRQMTARRPEMIDLIGELAGRKQIEIIGGAMYDPILPALSETERAGQIKRYADYIEKLFGGRPKGLWVTERVWEPHLCKALEEAGIEYVFLDDHHIAAADGFLDGPGARPGVFITEDGGHRVKFLTICRSLRSTIQENPSSETFSFMGERISRLTAAEAVTCVVDGERFAGGPESRNRGFDGRWIEQVLASISAVPGLSMATPSEAVQSVGARGPVYIPAVSYDEMSAWTLSTARGAATRGGIWRGFFSKYPESNWAHKRVFAAIQKMAPLLDKLGADREARAIRDLLDLACCNDAYWHGAAGGIYSPRLRRALFANLLEAENRFSKKMGIFPSIVSDDVDADGHAEIMAVAGQWILAIKPSYGGGIVEWSFRSGLINFQNTVASRPEPPDRTADRKPKRIILSPDSAQIADSEPEPRQDGAYDRYRKYSALVFALDPAVALSHLKNRALPELAAADGPYEFKTADREESFKIHLARNNGNFSFEKDIVISKRESRLTLSAAMTPGPNSGRAVMGVGFDFSFCSDRHLQIRIGDTEMTAVTGFEREAAGTSARFDDRFCGMRLTMETGKAVRWLSVPSHTLSRADGGIERTFQGITLLLIHDSQDAGRQEMEITIDAAKITEETLHAGT